MYYKFYYSMSGWYQCIALSSHLPGITWDNLVLKVHKEKGNELIKIPWVYENS